MPEAIERELDSVERPNGLRHCDRIERIPVQTPLGTRLGLKTNPVMKLPVTFHSIIDKNPMINIEWVRLSPRTADKKLIRNQKDIDTMKFSSIPGRCNNDIMLQKL